MVYFHASYKEIYELQRTPELVIVYDPHKFGLDLILYLVYVHKHKDKSDVASFVPMELKKTISVTKLRTVQRQTTVKVIASEDTWRALAMDFKRLMMSKHIKD